MSVLGDLADLHTACLNRLVGAFLPKACKGVSLKEKGYEKIVDPRISAGDENIEPELLSVGVDDLQFFKVVGARSKVGEEGGIIRDSEVVEEQLSELHEMQTTPSTSVDNYLTSRDISTSPSDQESVAVLPQSAYSHHQQLIDQFCEENDVIAWTVTLQGTEQVQKVSGKHEDPELDELLSDRGSQEGIFLYDVDSSIYPVVRDSDMRFIKFIFAHRLITYAHNEQTTKVDYTEIDEIMLNHDRPILGHLPEEERDDYWQQCMLSLQISIDVMSESTDDVNVFEWGREKFLYDNSARSGLLEDIRSGLGIGEEA